MKNPFTRMVKACFHFQRQDRNAIIVLASLIVLVMFGHIVADHVQIRSGADSSVFEKALKEWEFNSGKITENKQWFPFDPNKISGEGLDSLDIPFFIKRNLLSYRDAGGRFLRPSDVRKIYGMNDSIFSVIEPFLRIAEDDIIYQNTVECSSDAGPETSDPDTVFFRSVEGKIRIKRRQDEVWEDKGVFPESLVELNSADSVELTGLRGIGPVFAARILKYRELLGGFHSSDQLLEVYGFPEETYNHLQNKIRVDTSGIRKLRLNFAGYAEMLRHPYLEREVVEVILTHREKSGPFISNNQLLELGLMDTMAYRRAVPYFTCR